MSKFSEILNATVNSVGVSLGFKEDPVTESELFDYESENKKFDIRYKKAFLKNRRRYGFYTFGLVACWLITMLYVTVAQGLGRLPWKDSKFSLSEAVIIALITTTTINVLALLVIVLRNLFPSIDKNAPNEP